MLGFLGKINLPIKPEISPAHQTLPVCLSNTKVQQGNEREMEKLTPVVGEGVGAGPVTERT